MNNIPDTIRTDFGGINNGTKVILSHVYEALDEKGYDAINQIVGYLVSEDPQYITSHKDARNLIVKLNRDEVIGEMLKKYIGVE